MMEKNEFSLEIVKSCIGRTESDIEYLKWFVAECDKRIAVATTGLAALVSGKDPLTETSLGKAAALRAEVRLMTYFLNEGATWFAKKPKLTTPFVKMLSQHAAAIKQADKDYQMLQDLYN